MVVRPAVVVFYEVLFGGGDFLEMEIYEMKFRSTAFRLIVDKTKFSGLKIIYLKKLKSGSSGHDQTRLMFSALKEISLESIKK